jgi:hypothetical protein
MILPRQARDKHRENSKKERFLIRSSNDIHATWASVVENLQSVIPHQPWLGSAGEVVTGPGCFAYPDGLEVGNLPSFAQDQSTFGAWVIVSCVATLGLVALV